jgi:DNA transformation protein
MDPEALRDLFQELGAIRIRRMFGGQGVFHDGLMFALVANGELYLKVDAESRRAFVGAASRPFVYDRSGRPVEMSYWLMPDDGLDDPSEAARWAGLALAAARRANGRKAAPRPSAKLA